MVSALKSTSHSPYGQNEKDVVINSNKEPSQYTTLKYIAHIISLYYNYVVSFLSARGEEFLNTFGFSWQSRYQWWNCVDGSAPGPALYLGALPLVQKVFCKIMRNDADSLENLGISAVLSAVEPFENNYEGCCLSPVTPEQWQEKKISQLQLSTPDLKPIDQNKIEKGVEFIHENLKEGRSVYVHCKAGRGRSVLIVLCFLIKYRNMALEKARAHLLEKRPQASFPRANWHAAQEYAKNLLFKQKSSL
jgi:protein tyrosine phosphatase